MKKILVFTLIIISKISSKKEWWENSEVFEFTNDNIHEYIGSDKYIIIEFFTKWCMHCRNLFPIYEKIFKIFNNTRKDIIIGRINGESNSKTSEEFGIFAFPNIVAFKPNNKKIESIYIGKPEINEICAWINQTCPVIVKKNLKGKIQNNYNQTNNTISKIILNKKNKTHENEYFKRNIVEIKERINNMEEIIEKFEQSKIKKIIISGNPYIKIKINFKIILIIIIIIFLYYISKEIFLSSLFSPTQIPKELHQKS
jgi:thioredoxin-like negative regulator of GroEL